MLALTHSRRYLQTSAHVFFSDSQATVIKTKENLSVKYRSGVGCIALGHCRLSWTTRCFESEREAFLCAGTAGFGVGIPQAVAVFALISLLVVWLLCTAGMIHGTCAWDSSLIFHMYERGVGAIFSGCAAFGRFASGFFYALYTFARLGPYGSRAVKLLIGVYGITTFTTAYTAISLRLRCLLTERLDSGKKLRNGIAITFGNYVYGACLRSLRR
jgi:hypothetical protein